MVSRQSITAIDVHAAGEPGRVIMGSHLLVKGKDMSQRLQYCKENLEGLRRLLLREPRGYPALCGVLVLPPINEDSDFGIIVLEQGTYAPMSGANLICAVTALIDTKALPVTEPLTHLKVDTAVGVVMVRAEIHEGRAVNVALDNVPAFAVALDHELQLPEYGTVKADIVFGGQYYVQARDKALGLDLKTSTSAEIIRAATVLRLAAMEQFPVQHPLEPLVAEIGLPMIYGEPEMLGAHGKNAVVLPGESASLADPGSWGSGTLDRSPCGTGTCGRMAARYARGELALHEAFVHESMLGTTFQGVLHGTATVGPYDAVLPTISGRGWVTGIHQFILDSDDPFQEGFMLGDIWGTSEPNVASVSI